MGLIYILLASLFIALSNYSMRRSIDVSTSKNTKGFFMVQTTIVFLLLLLLHPVRTGNYEWSTPLALFGLVGGLVLAIMMISIGKALQYGPPGLSFAIFNASCVVPILFMVAVCGAAYGYVYELWNGLGSLLVVLGLFWAGWQSSLGKQKVRWLTFIMTAFILHVAFLLFLQWKALFINPAISSHSFLISFTPEDVKTEWFLPSVFLAIATIQTLLFLKEGRKLEKGELKFGVLGGLFQGTGTFFLMRSLEVSSPTFQAMLFPIYSVVIIIVCNIWGVVRYKEKINWPANALCVLGILVGTINWKLLLS